MNWIRSGIPLPSAFGNIMNWIFRALYGREPTPDDEYKAIGLGALRAMILERFLERLGVKP